MVNELPLLGTNGSVFQHRINVLDARRRSALLVFVTQIRTLNCIIANYDKPPTLA
jgi:hypothetical protein